MRCVYRWSIEIDVKVEYDFTPGRPEQGPSYSSGGEPAEPPEIEVVNVWAVDGDGKWLFSLPAPSADLLRRLLNDEEYQERLFDFAADAMAEMADEAAERRADLRRDR